MAILLTISNATSLNSCYHFSHCRTNGRRGAWQHWSIDIWCWTSGGCQQSAAAALWKHGSSDMWHRNNMHNFCDNTRHCFNSFSYRPRQFLRQELPKQVQATAVWWTGFNKQFWSIFFVSGVLNFWSSSEQVNKLTNNKSKWSKCCLLTVENKHNGKCCLRLLFS